MFISMRRIIWKIIYFWKFDVKCTIVGMFVMKWLHTAVWGCRNYAFVLGGRDREEDDHYYYYYQIMFIIIKFRLGCDRPSGLLLFVPAVLFSILTPLFCPSSSVSLSYLILAVPIRECLGKHSYMSPPFPITILNGASSFLSLVQENINMPSGHYYRLCSWIGR